MLPSFLGTWYVGRMEGFFIAAVCGITWLATDVEAATRKGFSSVPFYNAAFRTAVFLIIAWLISRMRELTNSLGTRVRQRTAELEQEVAERKRAEDQLRESERR